MGLPLDLAGRAGRRAATATAARAATVLLQRASTSGDTAQLADLVDRWERIVGDTPEGHRQRGERLTHLGIARRLRFTHGGQREDLDAAIQTYRTALPLLRPGRSAHRNLLNNLGAALLDRHRLTGDRTDLDAAIALFTRVVAVTPVLHHYWAIRMVNLATALQTRYELTEDLADLDQAIALKRKAVRRARFGPYRAALGSSLGNALRMRYERLGDVDDLDEAVEVLTAAVEATPAGHADRPLRLSNMSIALSTRFERSHGPEDLDRALAAAAAALELSPSDHPERAMYYNNLGHAHHLRFELLESGPDLDSAIDCAEHAVRLTDAGDAAYGLRCSNLGIRLLTRFDHAADTADLTAAVTWTRAAVAGRHTAVEHAALLSNLGIALHTRFQRTGDRSALQEALNVLDQAVARCAEGHPDRPSYLGNHAGALLDLFATTDDLKHVEAAVAAADEALRTGPDDHPERSLHLMILGVARLARFERLGADADLDAALAAAREALHRRHDHHHPIRRGYLLNLANGLHRQFARTGSLEDLDTALGMLRTAMAEVPPGHPDRPKLLRSSGIIRQSRFEWSGAETDLDGAVEALRAAVDGVPVDHPDRPGLLWTLSGVLLTRFYHVGALSDAEDAATAAQTAVQASPPEHPDLPSLLHVLAAARHALAERTGDGAEYVAATVAMRQAVAATPPDHAHRSYLLHGLGLALHGQAQAHQDPVLLDEAIGHLVAALGSAAVDRARSGSLHHGLAAALLDRFGRSGATSDAENAVRHAERAVEAVPVGHPERPRHLVTLAEARRALLGPDATQDALDQIVQPYLEAAEALTAPATIRIAAARAAAELLAPSVPSRAARLLADAVQLLPLVAPRHLARTDRQSAVADIVGLAADAAALTLAGLVGGEHERAARSLQLLESGRAILLGQALRLRGELDDLRQSHSDLAARFVELRDLLDRPARGGFAAAPPASSTAGPLLDLGAGRTGTVDWSRDELRRRRDHADQLTDLLDEIHSRPGFAAFAEPPDVDQLLATTAAGPVAVVNVSHHGSHALLVTPDGVRALPLPLRHDELADMVLAFHAPDASGMHERQRRVLGKLWDGVAGPVLDGLGFDRRPTGSGRWPRMWWAMGGPLSLLPLHAAGHHSPDGVPEHDLTVLDRVVSSYSPTIGALRHARRRSPTPDLRNALVVAMPTTPDAERLSHASDEVAAVAGAFPDALVLVEPDSGSADPTDRGGGGTPTRDAVLNGLTRCAVAHFACHGIDDPNDPANSRLLLHDHVTRPFTVAELMTADLTSARLAYLSACRTAITSSSDLLDEAVHLASAFQLAGFRQVVGTLFDVLDKVAADIASTFYAGLRVSPPDDGSIDFDRAPFALHEAIRMVRAKYPTRPAAWAAHLHSGA